MTISDEELRKLAVEQDASKCPNDGEPLQRRSGGGKSCSKCVYHESEEGAHDREVEVDTHNEYVPLLLELLELRASVKIAAPACWPPQWGDADPPEASADFGVATPMGSAAMYDEASGVKGWTAKVSDDGKRIEMIPPPGSIICYDAQGRPGLFRASTLAKIGISVRKIAE